MSDGHLFQQLFVDQSLNTDMDRSGPGRYHACMPLRDSLRQRGLEGMKMSAIVGVSPRLLFRLPVTFKRTGDQVVAICEALDVASQGRTQAAAKAAIIEAVSLFLETCFEMGTLDDVLRERGFTQMQPSSHSGRDQEMIEVPMELVANAKANTRKLRPAC
jgi:predicted RNase H-like HicB family nuclease